ncbi:MAG: type II secretion system protein GspK [Kiritimatiellaeota bacterium]|nr:type II secretion system protein GspK [Kiritimatiellota bacterium]
MSDEVFQGLESSRPFFPRLGKVSGLFSKVGKTAGLTFPSLGKNKGVGFQSLEKRGGSALIVVMWVLLILALLVTSMVYDMHIEASITAYQRNRTQAQQFAKAGVEFARYLLWKSVKVRPAMGTATDDDPDIFLQAVRLQRGMSVTNYVHEFGVDGDEGPVGKFTLSLIPEQAFRNINRLNPDTEWPLLLQQAGITEDLYPELVDCVMDWIDANDNARVNGAESDDPYYVDRGYPTKNALLDSVEELLMIKGWTKAMVFGGSAVHDGDPSLTGIAPLATVWGDGRINVNAAPREVLMTLPTIDDVVADDIIAQRTPENTEGTIDEGYKNDNEVFARSRVSKGLQGMLTAVEHHFMRVQVRGECQGVHSGIRCVMWNDNRKFQPVFWREGEEP